MHQWLCGSAEFAIGRLRVRISTCTVLYYYDISVHTPDILEYQLLLGRQRQVWLIQIADERVGVQVKLGNPLRTCAIPGRFCGGDSLRRGIISSVCTFTFISWKSVSASLRFNGHSPGGSGLADTRTSPFWMLLELRIMEVVVTTGATRCTKLQSYQHRQPFTAWMPFLSPNQQCHSTED